MFNIGDRVRVKENANVITDVRTAFNALMLEYLGKESKIIKSDGLGQWKLEGFRHKNFSINGDGYWWWATEWLELINDVPVKEITDDDFGNLFN